MRNQKKDAIEMAAKKQKILATGFRLFSEKTIEKVTMNNVADACGIGVATLYRYYGTKPALVLGIATWLWESYAIKNIRILENMERKETSDVKEYEFFLDAFIDLYRNHKDMLRFNQQFNNFIRSENIAQEQLEPYNRMIKTLEKRFHETVLKGKQDGTIRTDLPEEIIFSTTIHLMLSVTMRYASGLLYEPLGEEEAERELIRLKRMLLTEFAPCEECNFSPQNAGNRVRKTG